MNRTKVKCDRLISSSVTLPYRLESSEAYSIVKKKLARALKANVNNAEYSIYKKSIDARRKEDIRFVYIHQILLISQVVLMIQMKKYI